MTMKFGDVIIRPKGLPGNNKTFEDIIVVVPWNFQQQKTTQRTIETIAYCLKQWPGVFCHPKSFSSRKPDCNCKETMLILPLQQIVKNRVIGLQG